MMAFLLDIITFLQISFSTNIFRINYRVYKTNNDYYIRVSYRNSYNSDNNIIIFEDLFSKFEKIYFDNSQLLKQQYKNCSSFQLY
ncbi:hypothetical protein FM755_06965 [Francisella tularensis]|uniref:Uncharacterized protein n=3 Tax=Francisella tularensis subsp. holarctica TaxID=119857 RepID=A0ABF7PSI6_FRATH|nr:hypothetical protein [Francisella tularensis]AHH46434.1 hypothetical protein X557_05300 [Francisella tularensis subsp. holarctica PHIT-FT049]EBA52600.1 hypothetical protein FTHG_00967 [Francisella tularensis subsp. holarctica 257]MDN9004014.1 hypothetical protein [Francisella tularensis subsp. mediasiatica]ABI82889.1 conserved hypothetical protein [Francisella tularensis subsp. holarctica OSU18]ADA78246.1 hypothetical protein NE061598_03180 [Francisella tularensis subsp. tularensis NE061598